MVEEEVQAEAEVEVGTWKGIGTGLKRGRQHSLGHYHFPETSVVQFEAEPRANPDTEAGEEVEVGRGEPLERN